MCFSVTKTAFVEWLIKYEHSCEHEEGKSETIISCGGLGPLNYITLFSTEQFRLASLVFIQCRTLSVKRI